jgi:hypothetical protein
MFNIPGTCLMEKVPGSTMGSKRRNLLTYVIIVLTLFLLLELYFGALSYIGLKGIPQIAWLFCLFSGSYFFMTTIGVIRLISHRFRIAPGRLARDVLVSAVFSVVSFALYFKSRGITATLKKAMRRRQVTICISQL